MLRVCLSLVFVFVVTHLANYSFISVACPHIVISFSLINFYIIRSVAKSNYMWLHSRGSLKLVSFCLNNFLLEYSFFIRILLFFSLVNWIIYLGFSLKWFEAYFLLFHLFLTWLGFYRTPQSSSRPCTWFYRLKCQHSLWGNPWSWRGSKILLYHFVYIYLYWRFGVCFCFCLIYFGNISSSWKLTGILLDQIFKSLVTQSKAVSVVNPVFWYGDSKHSCTILHNQNEYQFKWIESGNTFVFHIHRMIIILGIEGIELSQLPYPLKMLCLRKEILWKWNEKATTILFSTDSLRN